MADVPITLLIDFTEAVKKWKSKWVIMYKARFLKKAEDSTFTYRKVVIKFEETLNKDASIIRQGIVLKGAFRLMFDGEDFKKARLKKS